MATMIYYILPLLFAINKVESTDITSFSVGTGTLPDDGYHHRGYYSSTDDKIYFIGGAQNGGTKPWVFDPATQQSQLYDALGDIIATVWGQFGAAINDAYYYIDQESPKTTIRKFDPINGIYDDNFVTGIEEAYKEGQCITSDNDKLLYFIRETTFESIDVTDGTIQALNGPTPSPWPACAYYEGYVYIFAWSETYKYDTVTDTWAELSGVAGVSMERCEAAVGANGKIYIGGSARCDRGNKVYEFDPVSETLALAPLLSGQRCSGALVYSPYDNRLYVFAGRIDGGYLRDYEMSNALEPINPCPGFDCDSQSDGCASVTCDAATAQCVSTPILTCSDNKMCVDPTDDIKPAFCSRDCSAFIIDDFLRDCSDEFKGNEADITTLTSKVTALENDLRDGGATEGRLDNIESLIQSNDGEIEAIEDRLAVPGGDIDLRFKTVEGNVEAIAEGLSTTTEQRFVDIESDINSITPPGIKKRLDALEDQTAEGGVVEVRFESIEATLKKFSAAHFETGNVIGGIVGEKTADSLWISAELKDKMFMFLLILNTVLIVGLAIACVLLNKSRNSKKYQQISYSTDDENQRLQR